MTPVFRARRLGERVGVSNLWIKDEGRNPAGVSKAREIACAVSMSKERGASKLAIASTGNAAAALALYAAAAQLEAHVFLPNDASNSNFIGSMCAGARVTLVDGTLEECAKLVEDGVETHGWHDVGPLREPYRLEGAKTMGYETAEQFGWELPDVVVCPAGSGLTLAAIRKAFDEMEALGWIGGKRPRMVAVQAEGCMPLALAWREGERRSRAFQDAHTVAGGLRVPKPPADFLALDTLRASDGAAVAVSDEAILDAGIELASSEGLFAAPEGAACVAALRPLVDDGFLKADEKVLIYNTGSGLKYTETYATRFPRMAFSEQDKLGGLITPR